MIRYENFYVHTYIIYTNNKLTYIKNNIIMLIYIHTYS